jgi:hypothetical protein
MEERFHIKHRLPFEHVIDRPPQFVGQDRQGFAFAVFALQFGQELLPRRIVAQKQHGRVGEGPLEVGSTNFLAWCRTVSPRIPWHI